MYEKIVDETKLVAKRIFNVDESRFSTVQKNPQKVIGERGKKKIRSITNGERGINTTMVTRMTALLSEGAPAGSLVTILETGYINNDLFDTWLQNFITHVRPSKEQMVLLLLNGHTTHSKNLKALTITRDNGIILLYPGHTTHRLQPLDVGFFKAMSTCYIQAIEKWLRTNVGRPVTQFQVSQLLNEAYERSATVGNATSGFKASGIWPVNRHVFQEHLFPHQKLYCLFSP